jgi:NAD(P)-dependent dehydrogenase (short-subunit alcohol dehydrogenase family)
MDARIKGRRALVTGGSQGIGEFVVRDLASEGARVAFTYRSEKARADAIVDAITRAGGEALALPLDLDDLTTVSAAAQAVLDRWGGIDILVNNAVKWHDQIPQQMPAFESIPLEAWQSHLRANLEGAYLMTQLAVPSMRKNGWGRIVNISSGVALDGIPGGGPYAAAKMGIIGLTNVLARELGGAGILVNVVVPGLTMTDRMSGRFSPEVQEQRGKAYPVKRLLKPEEVASAIVFLASGLNTAITGETIRASGGRPM